LCSAPRPALKVFKAEVQDSIPGARFAVAVVNHF
jgi:hypothetical protein